MKRFRRVFAVLLAAALVLTMLAACDSTSTEDRVLATLNEVRTQTYGLSPLTRSAEADEYALRTAQFLETALRSDDMGGALVDWAMELAPSTVGGRGYKTSMFLYNPDSVTADKFLNEKVATAEDGMYVGMAEGSVLHLHFMILTVY